MISSTHALRSSSLASAPARRRSAVAALCIFRSIPTNHSTTAGGGPVRRPAPTPSVAEASPLCGVDGGVASPIPPVPCGWPSSSPVPLASSTVDAASPSARGVCGVCGGCVRSVEQASGYSGLPLVGALLCFVSGVDSGTSPASRSRSRLREWWAPPRACGGVAFFPAPLLFHAGLGRPSAASWPGIRPGIDRCDHLKSDKRHVVALHACVPGLLTLGGRAASPPARASFRHDWRVANGQQTDKKLHFLYVLQYCNTSTRLGVEVLAASIPNTSRSQFCSWGDAV